MFHSFGFLFILGSLMSEYLNNPEMKKIMNKIKATFLLATDLIRERKIFGLSALDILSKTIMGALLVILIVSMMPHERLFEYGNLMVGSIAQEEIIAPFTFPVIKSQRVLEQERQYAWKNQPTD